MTQAKVWGTTNKIFEKNNVEIHRLDVLRGGYCSKHYHDFKFNGFFCEKGLLKVQTWMSDSDIINTTILNSGAYTIVEPKIYHKFIAEEPSIVYEIYWVELSDNDIIRQSFGGLNL